MQVKLKMKNSSSTWLQNINVNGNNILFKLDIGAKVDIMPHIVASRKIILALHDKVKHELQCMIE